MNTRRRARGPTGTVRGVPEDVATLLMMQTCRIVADRFDETFQRSDLLDASFEAVKAATDDVPSGSRANVAEGIALQIERTPAVLSREPDTVGVYRLNSNWEVFVAFRTWRFALGQVDAYEACVLLSLLGDLEKHGAPDRLAAMRERLERAVASLREAT